MTTAPTANEVHPSLPEYGDLVFLANILSRPDAFADVREIVKAEHFEWRTTENLFARMKRLADDGHPVTLQGLRQSLVALPDDQVDLNILDLETLVKSLPKCSAKALIREAKGFAEAGRKRLEREAKAKPAPKSGGITREAILLRLSDVQAENVQWLWPSRFALGKLSLLVGDPSVGKSFLTCALAAAVSRGAPWPDGSGHAPLGSVVVLNAEDGLSDTIKPRLVAAGADCEKVVALEGVTTRDEKGTEIESGFSLGDVQALEAALITLGDCKLVVIDPVSAFMGSTDSHINAEVRGLLKPLGDLAQRHRVAIVLVSHLNKGQAAAMYRTTGSLAFIAAARAAWCCMADKDDPARRKMLCLKNNLAPDPGGFGYVLKDGFVQWTGPVYENVDEALAVTRPESGGSAVNDAVDLLQSELGTGCKTARDILKSAREAGVSERTLRDAKSRLRITSCKINGAWCWQLPAGETSDYTDSELERMADEDAGSSGHAR